MQARLIPVDATAEMPAVHLDQFPVLVGRTDEADLTLNDRWVSRRHCVLEWQEGAIQIRDLSSKHGTFVNNEAVSAVLLQAGDRVAIGMSTFVVSYQKTTELAEQV